MRIKNKKLEVVSIVSVIAVALILRVYNVFVPILCGEELMVLGTVKESFAYVLNSSMHLGNHMVYYQLFCKVLKLVGLEGELLRLPSVLVGVLVVFAIYAFVKENYSVWAGVLSAFYVAINIYAVKYSRQVLPYSYLMLLCILSFGFMLRFLKSRSNNDLYSFCVVNLLMLMFHQLAAPILLSEVLVLFLYCAVVKKSLSSAQIYICLVWGGACLLVVGSSLAGAVKDGSLQTLVGLNIDVKAVIGRLGYVLDLVTSLKDNNKAFYVALFMAFVGFLRVAYFKVSKIALVAPVLMLAFTGVVVADKSWTYAPEMCFYIIPLFAIYTGIGFDLVLSYVSERFSAYVSYAVFVALCAYMVWQGDYGRVYGRTSYLSHPHETIDYMVAAKYISSMPIGNGFVVVDCNRTLMFVETYSDLLKLNNPFDVQQVASSGRELIVTAASHWDMPYYPFGSSPWKDRESKAISVGAGGCWRQWTVNRTPVVQVDRLPYVFDTKQDAFLFFETVHSMSGLACNFSSVLMPSSTSRGGSFQFVFDVGAGFKPDALEVSSKYTNIGYDNTYQIEVCFDGEAFQSVFLSNGPDDRHENANEVKIPAGTRQLTVRVSMYCNGVSPELTAPMATVYFSSLKCVLR